MIGHKTIPSRDGGIEVVVEELATRMILAGHEVICFNRKRSGARAIKEYKGVKIKNIFTINKKSLDAIIYSFLATRKAYKLAKKGKLDVIHFHAEGQCNFLNIFGKLGSKRRNKMPKILVTIHGLDWQRGKWGGLATRIIMRGEKQAVKYADEVIVLSKGNKQYFKDVYNRETTFISNGVSPAIFRSPNIIKNKWSLDKGSYILFLARIVPEKGLHYLVEAWKGMSESEKNNKKLVIAGGASHTNKYFDEVSNACNADDSIIMTGFVQGEVLQELYSNAYLYVLPSDVEGMPMSLLEAMSYGNICLVSNIPENMEVIRSDDYIFERGNVKELRKNIVQIIGLNSTTHKDSVIKFTWDKVVEKTLKVYER